MNIFAKKFIRGMESEKTTILWTKRVDAENINYSNFKNIKTHKNVLFLFIYLYLRKNCIDRGIFYYDWANKVIQVKEIL